jgi:hypothetical protein
LQTNFSISNLIFNIFKHFVVFLNYYLIFLNYFYYVKVDTSVRRIPESMRWLPRASLLQNEREEWREEWWGCLLLGLCPCIATGIKDVLHKYIKHGRNYFLKYLSINFIMFIANMVWDRSITEIVTKDSL